MTPTSQKLLIGSVVGAGAIAAYSYVRSITRAQAQLQIIPNVKIHKLGWDGLTLRIDALMKNPTQGSFTIKFPFIELFYNGDMIGSSQVINKDIHIIPFGQVLVEGMMVNIPVFNMGSTAYKIIQALLNDKPITFTIAAITTVSLGWTSIAYESRQDITLKQ